VEMWDGPVSLIAAGDNMDRRNHYRPLNFFSGKTCVKFSSFGVGAILRFFDLKIFSRA